MGTRDLGACIKLACLAVGGVERAKVFVACVIGERDVGTKDVGASVEGAVVMVGWCRGNHRVTSW